MIIIISDINRIGVISTLTSKKRFSKRSTALDSTQTIPRQKCVGHSD